MISVSPLRAVVKVTPSEKADDESDPDLDRDEEFRSSAARRQSPIRDESETLRSDRENFISGFEGQRKPSRKLILSTQSEDVPYTAIDALKPIINHQDHAYAGQTQPDFHMDKDDMSQSYQMHLE